jgi:Na+-transporting NADH:ubiquinone oxidoreductase subunit NqrC
MKIPFYISVAASGLSLILSVVLLIFGGIDQGLQAEIQKQQAELQKQQEQINTGNTISTDVGPKLLQDMAQVSIKDEKMKELLAKHGYTVATPAPSPAKPAAPASAPAPAATPTLRP